MSNTAWSNSLRWVNEEETSELQNGSPGKESSWSDQITPPIALQKEFTFTNKLLMIPGPTNMALSVLRAMSKPILSHVDEQFFGLLRQIQGGIRYLFQTQNEYTFALTGSATSSMEMPLVNLLVRGDSIVTLVAGHWGERVALMGERLGLNVVRLHVPNARAACELNLIEGKL